AEHDLGERFGEGEDGRLKFFRDMGESNRKKDSEHGNLQDLVFSDGLDDIFRKDVQQDVVPVERRGLGRNRRGTCAGARWDDQTFAGSSEIDGGDADEKRDSGGGFEVDEAFQADAADFAQVAVSGDAGDERAENERSDDDFDKAKENVAENAQTCGDAGGVQAKLEAGQHSEEDPEGERAFLKSGED